MTSTQPRATGFPSVPRALVAALGERFTVYAATRFPGPGDPYGDVQALIAAGTPVARVLRLGGRRDRLTDYARVVVDVIAADEPTAEDLAEEIATWLADTRPIRAAGLLLDGADVEIAPHPLPYADPSISQFSATYVVSSRRIEARSPSP